MSWIKNISLCKYCRFSYPEDLLHTINGICKYCIKDNIKSAEDYKFRYPSLLDDYDRPRHFCHKCYRLCPAVNPFCSEYCANAKRCFFCHQYDCNRKSCKIRKGSVELFFKETKSGIPEAVEMPQMVDEHSGELVDIDFPDNTTLDMIMANDLKRSLIERLTPKQYKIFILTVEGYDQGEIGKMFGFTHSRTEQILKQIKHELQRLQN